MKNKTLREGRTSITKFQGLCILLGLGIVFYAIDYYCDVARRNPLHEITREWVLEAQMPTLNKRTLVTNDGETLTRFLDYHPFGSLDEDASVGMDSNITILRPGDKGFGVQENAYKNLLGIDIYKINR